MHFIESLEDAMAGWFRQCGKEIVCRVGESREIYETSLRQREITNNLVDSSSYIKNMEWQIK
jgi:hypothetical protein